MNIFKNFAKLSLARTRHIQDSEDVFQEVFARLFCPLSPAGGPFFRL